jgi:hypothetical protein
MRIVLFGSVAGVLIAAGSAVAQFNEVFPSAPHAANNFIPFGIGTTAAPIENCTQHQVFLSTLFTNVAGQTPVTIEKISFAPGVNGTYFGNIVVRLGYTSAIPGVSSAGGGLAVPTPGGGGTPNASGAMHDFFSDANYTLVTTNQSNANFQMELVGAPFTYDPAVGNLLVEIVSIADRGMGGIDLTASRHGLSTESSRAYSSLRFGSTESFSNGTRMRFTFSPASGGCYANCDSSTVEPVLNVDDFTCFINEFAQASSLPHEQQVAHYANCDDSTIAPVLNVDDFTCFINQFAQGCP